MNISTLFPAVADSKVLAFQDCRIFPALSTQQRRCAWWRRSTASHGTRLGNAGANLTWSLYGKEGTAPAIPDWAEDLIEKMLLQGLTMRRFDQMLVNEYQPGQGIALHRDYQAYGRTVASLSLLSVCVMDFRHQVTERSEVLLLEPRSLLILNDQARYEWEHDIASRKSDVWYDTPVTRERRLSITFRTRTDGQGEQSRGSLSCNSLERLP